MTCRVYKYSLIISIEKPANCFHFYWITANCWFIKFRLTFSYQKRLNSKSQTEAEVVCSRPVNCRDCGFAARCEETGSDWQLSGLLAELFCKWWWGLSDDVGWDERRRANALLSSEEIQFHSINIDILLSPTKFALGPLVRQIRAGGIETPPRLWYLGVQQQMARPLAPWILPAWTALSFLLLCYLAPLPGCLSWLLPLSQRWLAVSRITKAPSHRPSKNKLPSPEHHPRQGLFTVVLTEKLEDGRLKHVLIWI